jgi:lipid-A-disaccharide synthase-like uncharacterized protein
MIWDAWVIIGFVAQALFSMRFIVQLIASERRKSSYIPEAFWYLSIIGGAMLLCYAIKRKDPVFILGQSTGVVVYARNLYFINKNKKKAAEVAAVK